MEVDDRGRVANDILIDDNGNIYVAGTKYRVLLNLWKSKYLSSSEGQYQSSVWKYDSNGQIDENFGNPEYENGSIPGLKFIDLWGEDKIQRIMSVKNEILAYHNQKI